MKPSDILLWTLAGALAYLLGSLPFGYLIARCRGIDIRTVGSGNIGATNVFRAVSKPLGILTFALDVAKGVCGTLVIPLLIQNRLTGSVAPEALRLFCGFFTVAGHNWTCFLGFKGGKGVATSAGMMIGLTPLGVGIAFAAWLVTFLTTRYVSVASILAAVVLGVGVWFLPSAHDVGAWFPAVLSGLAALVVWKHRANIARLRAGTESRFTFKKKASA
jgi:glycerol-3-phosphate acyltransferase PlsY